MFGIVLPGRAQSRAPVFEVRLERGVTAPAVSLVRRALREAQAADAAALVIELRSRSAVLGAAWMLAREIRDAEVPVVVWVGPGPVAGGAAGALLVAASDIGALAPGATIGFAQPLTRSPAGFSLQTQQLVVDDVVAELTGWQRDRGRNAEWIERAVRSGAVIEAERALELDPPLADLIVGTKEELLTTLQGRRVTEAGGTGGTLETLGAPSRTVRATLLEGVAQLLAVPTVAFVLFVLGAIAIYLEFANPGIGIPGVTGGALVLAALYGFVQAEVRPLAVLLLIAGLVLVGLEHVVLSHGGLTLAGVILLVLGALWLVDPLRSPGFAVALPAIGGTTVLLIGAVAALVALAVRVRGKPPVTGAEALVGQVAEVRQAIDPEGTVFVQGALWSAWSDDGPLLPGDLVEVAGIENLRLYVRRLDREPVSLNA